MGTDWSELIKFALFTGALLVFYVILMSFIGAQGRIGKWLDWIIMTALGVAVFEEWQNRRTGGVVGLLASRKKGGRPERQDAPLPVLPPPPVPADWKTDPLGRYELRYWDGVQWTQHVATGGVVANDPL